MEMRFDSQRRMVRDWLNEGNSITPLEALYRFGAFRLSAIIYVLKNEYGMPIKTEMVQDGKKRYARYSLPQEYGGVFEPKRGDIVYVKEAASSEKLFKESLCRFAEWRDSKEEFFVNGVYCKSGDYYIDNVCVIALKCKNLLSCRLATDEEVELFNRKREELC